MDGFEDVNAGGKARRTGGGFLDGAKICNAIGQPPSLLRPYGGTSRLQMSSRVWEVINPRSLKERPLKEIDGFVKCIHCIGLPSFDARRNESLPLIEPSTIAQTRPAPTGGQPGSLYWMSGVLAVRDSRIDSAIPIS